MIGVTAPHPFWSEDRQAFIAAGDLKPGELLLTAAGDLTEVISLTPRPHAEPVYNLEVNTEHVYYVSNTGVLVHNAIGPECLRGLLPARLRFWNAPKVVNGRRVYQRDDLFDPNYVHKGLTNLQRMRLGKAPIGYDNKRVTMHHLIQQEPGAMAEVAGGFHSHFTRILHGLVGRRQSFRYSPNGRSTEADKAYISWRSSYWKERAREIE